MGFALRARLRRLERALFASKHMVKEGTAPRRATGAAAETHAAVEVIDSTGRLGAGVAWLKDRAGRAAAALRVAGEVRVRVVDDATMTEAHQRWHGQPGTTDVLTFDYSDSSLVADRSSLPVDADILVCVDEASRQSSARGHAVERELLLYIIHGVLHCLGHDDHDDAAAQEMHRREDEVLIEIGVGATYRAEANTDRPGAPITGGSR